MKVYVILVTYNAENWIEECLKSLQKSTIKLDVLVVDNASSDATVDIVKKYNVAKLIQQQVNLGFGKANNIGLTYALQHTTDFVFLINQDVYIKSDCVEKLINTHLSNPEYGVLSPIHLNGSGTTLDINFLNYISVNKSYISDLILKKELESVYEVPFINAAGWLIPIKVVSNIGGFDPIFFHYGEDVNYCQRLQYHNYKIGFVPTAFMHHDRELRLKNKVNLLSQYELACKIKWSNINEDITNKFYEAKKIQIKAMVKSALRFKYYELKMAYSKYSTINNLKNKIFRSRAINKNLSSHYLDNDLDA